MVHPRGARAIRELLEADRGENSMEAIEGLENMSVVESRIEDLTSEDRSVWDDVMEAVGQRDHTKAAGPLIRALRAVAGLTVGDQRNVLRMIILGMLGVFYGFLVVLMLV